MRKSVWEENAGLGTFQRLGEDKKTDVLIIGGGICGILCAYFLKNLNIDYLLVEGSTVGSGVTKNTTAKVTSQHGLVYDMLMKSAGREKASLFLRANELAISKYRCLAENIDCDFEEKDSFVYSVTDREALENEVKALNSLGFDAELTENLEIPIYTVGAVKFPKQVQINPLKLIAGISKDLNIYEHTFVKEISGTRATTDKGLVITAKKIIVATHFPFINRYGAYFLKMYQHRSYVIALENAERLDGMYVSDNKEGLSFRGYKNLLLLGGAAHRTGKKGAGWQELSDFAKLRYPESREKYRWAAQDCMSLDSVPYIGRYSPKTPDILVATGFNKWGMTSSMVAAMILADMAAGKENRFSSVYSPDRSILKPQLFINTAETLINFLTPTIRRCPHLGCALKWNKYEHTWDCPCHGSRFTEEGELIDNPAMKGKKNI